MFVDASAIVAIIMREPAGETLSRDLEADAVSQHVTNPIALWEGSVALNRKLNLPLVKANALIADLLEASDVAIVPVSQSDISNALEAFDRFGRHRYADKDRNRGLNIAECFHYATAKAHGGEILTLDVGFEIAGLAMRRGV
jgi:ribonuclease VapC